MGIGRLLGLLFVDSLWFTGSFRFRSGRLLSDRRWRILAFLGPGCLQVVNQVDLWTQAVVKLVGQVHRVKHDRTVAFIPWRIFHPSTGNLELAGDQGLHDEAVLTGCGCKSHCFEVLRILKAKGRFYLV